MGLGAATAAVAAAVSLVHRRPRWSRRHAGAVRCQRRGYTVRSVGDVDGIARRASRNAFANILPRCCPAAGGVGAVAACAAISGSSDIDIGSWRRSGARRHATYRSAVHLPCGPCGTLRPRLVLRLLPLLLLLLRCAPMGLLPHRRARHGRGHCHCVLQPRLQRVSQLVSALQRPAQGHEGLGLAASVLAVLVVAPCSVCRDVPRGQQGRAQQVSTQRT